MKLIRSVWRSELGLVLAVGALFMLAAGILVSACFDLDRADPAQAGLLTPPIAPVLDEPPPQPEPVEAESQEPTAVTQIAQAEPVVPEEPVEAPDAPPADEPVAPAPETAAPAEPTPPAVVVAPPLPTEPVVAPVRSSAAPAAKSKPAKASKASKAAKDSVKAPAAASQPASSAVAAAPVKSSTQEKVAKPLARPARSSRRRRAARREAAPVVDPSVVPPEWNWFSVPLTTRVEGGKVRIVAVDAVPEPVVAVVAAVVPAEPAGVATGSKPIERSSIQATDADDAPAFQKALNKISRRRVAREAEAQRRQVVLPSAGGDLPGFKALHNLTGALLLLRTGSPASADAVSAADGCAQVVPGSVRPMGAVLDRAAVGVQPVADSGVSKPE